MRSIRPSFRWLRCIAQALKAWAGSVRPGYAKWICRAEKLGNNIDLMIKEPPMEPRMPSHPRLSEAELKQLETKFQRFQVCRLRSITLNELVTCAGSGATIFALLQEYGVNGRPALVVVANSTTDDYSDTTESRSDLEMACRSESAYARR